MNNLAILNYIRQNYSTIIEINPNATFQKKSEKMIRHGGKTELFETEANKVPINLQTDAQTKLLPVEGPTPTTNSGIQSRTQTPRVGSNSSSSRVYTYEELTAKGVLKPALQEILFARGLPKSGNKDVLIQRILDNQK
jgi:hypothetical protein